MDAGAIVVICIVGFASNFVGVVTGGSGILMTASMLWFGIPEHTAVANTRFSVLGTDITSIIAFHRAGRIRYRLALPLAAVSVLAAVGVAQMLPSLSKEALRQLIGATVLLMVVVTLAFPRVGAEGGRERGGWKVWSTGAVLIFMTTALSTVAGGAAGVLYSYVLVLVFGQTFLDSAGTRKIVALGLTVGAVPVFILQGLVTYEVAVPLLLSNAAGGWLGARFMIRSGEKAVRWVFLAGVALIAVWLLVSS